MEEGTRMIDHTFDFKQFVKDNPDVLKEFNILMVYITKHTEAIRIGNGGDLGEVLKDYDDDPYTQGVMAAIGALMAPALTDHERAVQALNNIAEKARLFYLGVAGEA